MDAKKTVQKSKEECVKETFEKFEKELRNLSEEDKEKLVENAKDQANFKVGTIKGSEDFEKFVDGNFEQINKEGIILESNNGEKSLNLTLSRIREEYSKNYKSDVARILFKEV